MKGWNALGLRVKKTVGSTVTWYLYDGAVPVLELNNDGTVKAINTFGPNGLISRRTNNATSFYTFDPLGNAANVISASGTVLYNCAYDAYGQPYGNATTLTYGYGAQYGYYRDSEASTADNLLLCTYRWYDPATARWLTRDPIGYAGGSNLYGYVGGNPVGGVDPLGLDRIYVGRGSYIQPGMLYFGGGYGVVINTDKFDIGITCNVTAGVGPGLGIGCGIEGGLSQRSATGGYSQDNVWGAFGGKELLLGGSISSPYTSDDDPDPWDRRFPRYQSGFGFGGGLRGGIGEGAGCYKGRQHSLTLMGSDVLKGAKRAWRWFRKECGLQS